jgi:hypothetical protein
VRPRPQRPQTRKITPMSHFQASAPQFSKFLKNIDKWLDKAEAYARAKQADPTVLLTSRLALDQFPLIKQIQIAADSARNGLARVTGKQAPAPADNNETSIDEIRARLKKTIAYLDTFSASDFEGLESRKVVLPGAPGKVAIASDHLYEHVIPTFYFHATTTYAILRHNGVDLGKSDYLGERKIQDG